MTNDEATYQEFRWLADVQQLEPAAIEEMNEIEKIARAISEISLEQTEFYTTS